MSKSVKQLEAIDKQALADYHSGRITEDEALDICGNALRGIRKLKESRTMPKTSNQPKMRKLTPEQEYLSPEEKRYAATTGRCFDGTPYDSIPINQPLRDRIAALEAKRLNQVSK